MATAELRVSVKASGPIFDGLAPKLIDKFMLRATHRLAETARDWIMIDAQAMDRSGRGGTGRAAEGVKIYDRGLATYVWGEMTKGEVWWPWLEGTSKRNGATRFGGYHTFRNNKNKLQDHTQAIIQPLVDELVRDLGGAP